MPNDISLEIQTVIIDFNTLFTELKMILTVNPPFTLVVGGGSLNGFLNETIDIVRYKLYFQVN